MTHVLCPQQYCVSKTMYHHHTLATFRALSALWIAGNIDKIVQSSFKAPLPLWKTHTNISFWQYPQQCTCFFTELHCHSDLQNSFNLQRYHVKTHLAYLLKVYFDIFYQRSTRRCSGNRFFHDTFHSSQNFLLELQFHEF